MKNTDKQNEIFDKIITGLEKVRERLIEFKKQKNSEIVIMKNGKIVKIKPTNIH